MSNRTPMDLYKTLLMPISEVATVMTYEGFKLDREYAQSLRTDYYTKMTDAYKTLCESIGVHFNFRSSLELINVLENKLKIELTNTTKKGNKTVNDKTIKELAKADARLAPLITARHYGKMISTYIDGPISYLDKEDRVHPGWNLLGTETGRWSSHTPFAVQTIPRDKQLKRLVIPDKGYMLVVCDYKQAELRVLAYYSQDDYLLEGSRKNQDLHAYTAAIFFETTPEEVLKGLQSKDEKIKQMWKDRRQISKNGNFLCVYRGNAWALANLLGIDERTAEKYQQTFFKRATKVMAWSDSVVKELKQNNFVMSCYGRRRNFPLYSISVEKEKGEMNKEAPNSVIQGTSVDFANYSGIELYNRLKKEGYLDITKEKRVKFLIQKHDEWVLEVPIDWFEKVKPLIIECFESPKLPMDVPMNIDFEISEKSWGELKVA